MGNRTGHSTSPATPTASNVRAAAGVDRLPALRPTSSLLAGPATRICRLPGCLLSPERKVAELLKKPWRLSPLCAPVADLVATAEPVTQNLCLVDLSAQRRRFQAHRACPGVSGSGVLAFDRGELAGHLVQLLAPGADEMDGLGASPVSHSGASSPPIADPVPGSSGFKHRGLSALTCYVRRDRGPHRAPQSHQRGHRNVFTGTSADRLTPLRGARTLTHH